MTTAWRQADKEVTRVSKSHAAQVIDMCIPPDRHTLTHTHTHSCSHSILHKPFLTFCPSALEQPRGGCLRSRSSRHSVPEAADGTVNECCKAWKTDLTSTDDGFRSGNESWHEVHLLLREWLIAQTPKTNYSQGDVSWQNKTVCTYSDGTKQ